MTVMTISRGVVGIPMTANIVSLSGGLLTHLNSVVTRSRDKELVPSPRVRAGDVDTGETESEEAAAGL